MKQKALARHGALPLLSSLVFTMMVSSVCSAQGQTDTAKQPQAAGIQKTEFAVGRNPDAIVFDGTNIWVANPAWRQFDETQRERRDKPGHISYRQQTRRSRV
jgi:hypothetical protein